MRISQKAKEETKERILQTAEDLFLDVGFEQTTTRQIASATGIAAGTLFNYFKTKETLAMSLLADVMNNGREDYSKRRSGEEDFEEDLFLLISSELRRLRPYRKFFGPVLESSMSLFSKSNSCPAGESAREEHLEIVRQIISTHSLSRIPSFISETLYWSLYIGILAFWAGDESRNQEETLELIDYSIKLFAQTISGNTSSSE